MRIFFTLLFIYLCSYSGLSMSALSYSAINSIMNYNILATVYPNIPAETELRAQILSENISNCVYQTYEATNKTHTVTLSTPFAPWDSSVDELYIYLTSAISIGYAIAPYVPESDKTDISWLALISSTSGSSSITICSK